VHSVSAWSTEFYGDMKALQHKAADPRLQKANAQPFEHQVVCPACHYPFPGGVELWKLNGWDAGRGQLGGHSQAKR
jgi:hypothetical protein